MSIRKILIGTAAFGLIACGGKDTKDTQPTGPEASKGKPAGKADAWNAKNDPERFARFAEQDFEYTLEKLPTEGEAAQIPWAADYWATYEDSTNHRYLPGELSPLEKYDVAFNDWTVPDGFMDLKPFDPGNCEAGFDPEYYRSLGPAAKFMSENKGNKKTRDLVYRNGNEDTPVCDDETKKAVETWWGLCHAWAPASINEPEPLYPVEENGVTFYSSDIKALLLTVYDSSKSMILGGRCNTKDVERDDTGRIKDVDCRDTNAGAFHVVMSNMLGRHKIALVEDRTFNYEVWNQPVRSFTSEIEEINLAEANKLLNLEESDTYKYNADAKRFARVLAEVQYITEVAHQREPVADDIDRYTRTDNYEYLLEMDAVGKIIGGEWLQGRAVRSRWNSVSEQPDFLWFSTGPKDRDLGEYSRANPHVSYSKIKDLLNRSRIVTTGGGVTETGVKVFGNNTVTAIPDNTAGAKSTITIDEDVTAGLVRIQLEISHTYIGDLVIELSHDNGFSKILRENKGGSAHDISTVIELSELSGKNLKGTFTLTVTDTEADDVGKVTSWAITAE